MLQSKMIGHFGYPLKLPIEWVSTRAPKMLIEFAKLWHTNKLSTLYELQDGRLLHKNLLRLIQELKDVLNDSKAMACGPSLHE